MDLVESYRCLMEAPSRVMRCAIEWDAPPDGLATLSDRAASFDSNPLELRPNGNVRAAATKRPRLLEDLQSTPAQRGPVLVIPLRAWGRDHPCTLVLINLCPERPSDLARACRRQHEELEGQLHDRPRPRRPHRLDRRRHLAVRQRPHVPRDLGLRTKHRTDPVAWVAGQLAPEGPRRWLLAPLCWIAIDADGERWMRVRLWGNSGGTIQIPRADDLLATTTYGLFI